MPAKSAKQEKFMQAVAHNPKFAKAAGVPQSVGKEFTKSGGSMKKTVKKMAMGGMGGMGGMGKAIGAKAPPKGSSMPAFAKSAAQGMMKRAPVAPPKGSSVPAFAKSSLENMMKRAKAGTAGAGKPVGLGALPPKVASKAGAVAGKMFNKGGLAAGHKAADGIASKGKTKAKMVTMGGSTGMKRGGKVC